MSSNSSFLERVSPVVNGARLQIPEPSLDWEQRLRRRMTFRNERNLYHRTCSLTGKKVISFHSPDHGLSVIDQAQWWTDQWDPLQYGKTYDPTRSFFEQYHELLRTVPRMSMVVSRCENSDYGPYCVDSKNCYMAMSCNNSEDMYYCFQTHRSKDCIDCLVCGGCELCYECIDCFDSFDCQHCQNCENSNGLMYCKDVVGCTDCIGCKNLVRKTNHIFNQPATKEEVTALKKQLRNRSARKQLEKKVAEAFLQQPHRATRLLNCEECTGDYLKNSKNCALCFYSIEQHDCEYVLFCPGKNEDCRDIIYSPFSQLLYDSISAVTSYCCAFLSHSWDNQHSYYCVECFYSKHLFGCVGLKRKEYCILNRQYSPEEYSSLLPRIIEQMVKQKEWGEFFPEALSPYAYNETIANDYFPLSETEALHLGNRWRKNPEKQPEVSQRSIPDTIELTDPAICEQTLSCQATGKHYRVIKPELSLYKRMNVPLPDSCPDERYRLRFQKRNKPKLYQRTCALTGKSILSSTPPTNPELIVDEGEFLKLLYT